MNNKIKLQSLIKSELDELIEKCNFTDEELEYVYYKSKDNTNVYISHMMNVSIAKVSCLARRVQNKISRFNSYR